LFAVARICDCIENPGNAGVFSCARNLQFIWQAVATGTSKPACANFVTDLANFYK
jgi:hypothetical protein